MKKILTVFTFMLASSVALANTKIGTVNSTLVFKNHPMYLKSKETISKKVNDFQVELQKDHEAIAQKQQELDDKKAKKMINQTNIKKEQQYIDDSLVLLEEKTKMFNEEKNKLESEARIGILTDIQKHTIDYAKKNGYEVIIDNDAVIYIDKSEDLTQKIIQYIEKNK